MENVAILSILTWTPALAAVLILLLPKIIKSPPQARDTAAKWIALLATLAVFGAAIAMTVSFDEGKSGYQFVEKMQWYGMISYHLGIDGISVLLILLTAFLMPLCIIASWTSITKRVVEYMAAFLILQSLMIGVFCALDIVLSIFSLKRASSPCISSSGYGAARTGCMRPISSSSTRFWARSSCWLRWLGWQ
jgi:NADH-quinone oxidoreductase subunit M